MNNLISKNEQNRAQFKRALKNPVTLIVGIFLAVTGILTLSFYLSCKGDFEDMINRLASSFWSLFPNYESSSEDLYKTASTIIFLSTIIAPLLSFIGYLLTFIGSGSNPSKSPKGGTVLLMVSSIVSLFGFAMILIMYLSSFETYTEVLDSRYASDDAKSMFIRVTLLVIVCMLYGISNLIFNCSLVGMCGGSKRCGGGAVLFAVASICVAFIYFVFVIDYTTENDRLSDEGNLFIATLVFSAISYILSAVFGFIFRGRINSSEAPAYTSVPAQPYMQTPVYPGYATPYEPYNPQPAYNPIENTQNIPAASPAQAVAVRTPVRESEESVAVVNDTPTNDAPAFCAQCGTPIKPEQVFCAQCGAKLK